jgi:hypothetical protein
MDANQNVPSERDWTIEEQEAFFASQDAVTLDFNSIPKQPPIAWSTSAWNGPIIDLDPNDPFWHMESLFSSGIHVTSITPPEKGWPIACYCPICKVTTFVLSPWAIKPSDGDYFRMNDVCGNEELSTAHNIALAVEQLRKDRKI